MMTYTEVLSLSRLFVCVLSALFLGACVISIVWGIKRKQPKIKLVLRVISLVMLLLADYCVYMTVTGMWQIINFPVIGPYVHRFAMLFPVWYIEPGYLISTFLIFYPAVMLLLFVLSFAVGNRKQAERKGLNGKT